MPLIQSQHKRMSKGEHIQELTEITSSFFSDKGINLIDL